MLKSTNRSASRRRSICGSSAITLLYIAFIAACHRQWLVSATLTAEDSGAMLNTEQHIFRSILSGGRRADGSSAAHSHTRALLARKVKPKKSPPPVFDLGPTLPSSPPPSPPPPKKVKAPGKKKNKPPPKPPAQPDSPPPPPSQPGSPPPTPVPQPPPPEISPPLMRSPPKSINSKKQPPSPAQSLPTMPPDYPSWDNQPGEPVWPPDPDYPSKPAPAPPQPPVPAGTLDLKNPPKEVAGVFTQVGVGYVVAVHMVQIPGANKFLFMERPSGKHPDRKNFIAGVYDLATNTFKNVANTDSLFCNGATLMSDGNIAVVGGHQAKSGYADGLASLRIFDRNKNTLTTLSKMVTNRWYPTATLLPNGNILVMGGTQAPGAGAKNNNNYEIWNPYSPKTPTTVIAVDPGYLRMSNDLYYPNNYILPTGAMFSYCNKGGVIMDPNGGSIYAVVPSHTTAPSARSLVFEYPYSGTSVMLPLTPENNYTPEFVFMGGQFTYGWSTTPATDMALRLKMAILPNASAPDGFSYTFENWTMEHTGIKRVMADSVLLPNGDIIFINGAQAGVAGDSATGGSSKAQNPNFWAILYSTDAELGSRTKRLARSAIARMYHSTCSLTIDGTILIAGCDRCNYFACSDPYSPNPTGLPEYRVEVFSPPAVFNTDRPTLLSAEGNITYNEAFTAAYDTAHSVVPVSGAVLVAPSATTHSTNMNQRVVGLEILADDWQRGELLLKGPPDLNIAPAGYYMLFLLNGKSYSTAQWVHLS